MIGASNCYFCHLGMSGAEHLGIASAHLKGKNESVGCANVHIEHSRDSQFVNSEDDQSVPSVCLGLSGERKTACCGNSVLSRENEDGDGITNLDAGKCSGDGFNAVRTVGESLGMLENKVQCCEPDGMGNKISRCSAAQQLGDGSNPANAVSEQPCVHVDVNLVSEPVEDVTRTLIHGNDEAMANSLSPFGTVREQPCTEDNEDCYGSAKHSNGTSACNNGEMLGDSSSTVRNNHTCVAIEDGNQVSSCDLTKQSGENMNHAPCHEVQTCDSSRSDHPIGQVSFKSELSDLNFDKANSFVLGPVAESLSPIENTVGLLGKHNSQSKSDGFGYVSSCDQPAEEKAGAQFQIDSTAGGNTVEGSSENNYQTGCVDGLLKKSLLTSKVGKEFTSPEMLAKSSRLEETPEALKEGNHDSHNTELSEQKAKSGSEAAPDNARVEQTTESDIRFIELSPTDGAQRSLVEVENSHHGMPESSCGVEKNKSVACDVKDHLNEQSGSLFEEITGKLHVVVFGCPADDTGGSSKRGRRCGKFSAVSMRKKYPQRSTAGRIRALHPRSQGTPAVPERSSKLATKTSSTGKRRGRRKKTEIEGKSYDQFSRMRTHLRYLLHRIRYEQNLLDAYSSEGWRGQSLEKLRPEKELQRAKADINRSKLKIRDLFRHLDSVSAEGKFPDSLFDSEGLIDSEDIFCAKCGSKELSADNDIILCDGTCDRGFHQFCLEPPLRTEEIPPGDQGWLCPACDCKTDCIDLLNDSQGTKLSIEDSWEKVFPEAVASLAGNEQDDIMRLPSDDSDDNDYNPDGPDDDSKVEGSGSSSDGSDSSGSDSSDFSSVSEDLGAIGGDDQYLGLPSDDSEDDDYDPDTANTTDDVERESSSSDFTSASEDLGAAVHDDGISGDDETMLPLLRADQDTADSPPLSGRRHVERLDYKKLYDDTYGNGPSDSSDDEEWTDMTSTCKRKGSTEGVFDSSIGNASASADGPRRRGRKKLNLQATNGLPAQPVKSPEKTSCEEHMKRPHNRLGETVTQRLYESFKENQYPDRTTKEKLAKELGLTPQKVDKWFGNARWSFNHHPDRMEASMRAAALHSTPPNVACNGGESASGDTSTAVSGYGVADPSKLDGKESSNCKSTPKTSRKRKNAENCQPIPQNLNPETSKRDAQTDLLQTPEVETDTHQAPVAQHGSRRKRRKSSA